MNIFICALINGALGWFAAHHYGLPALLVVLPVAAYLGYLAAYVDYSQQ